MFGDCGSDLALGHGDGEILTYGAVVEITGDHGDLGCACRQTSQAKIVAHDGRGGNAGWIGDDIVRYHGNGGCLGDANGLIDVHVCRCRIGIHWHISEGGRCAIDNEALVQRGIVGAGWAAVQIISSP